jgi:ubiquinone/menaquinone biosynthesis C-methylase UbiE
MSKAKAWSAYWAQMGAAGGCLPGAPPAVEQGIAKLWEDFGRRLPPQAELLDLACGTGAVLRAVAAGNAALRLTGVDYAALPSGKGKRARLIGETDIGDLPFADASFDAVTSQFGFEYSDVQRSAAEAIRVTRAGAQLQMVIHHCESPIVTQNRKRFAALEAIDRSVIFERARAAIAQQQAQDHMVNQAFALIAQSHADQPVVPEIAAGISHGLSLGKKGGIAEIDRIANNANQEISVLSALAGAAQDQQGIDKIASLLAVGFDCRSPVVISQGGQAPPIAWVLAGHRT